MLKRQNFKKMNGCLDGGLFRLDGKKSSLLQHVAQASYDYGLYFIGKLHVVKLYGTEINCNMNFLLAKNEDSNDGKSFNYYVA